MVAREDELTESEVLWPEAPCHGAPASAPGCPSSSGAAPPRRISSVERRHPSPATSRPVAIPRPRAARLPPGRVEHDDDDDYGVCGSTMVPPHVMVSRRRSEGDGAVAFSLRSGPGRARRDLSHLRNSVLRMTGFIEG